ncbi:MAG: hypothetical protein U0736_17195 [Gemmataceae bacterium]
MATTVRPLAGDARTADHPLRRRLARLRRRLRLVATARGVGWLVALVLTVALVTGLLDYQVHLPGLVRAGVLVGLLAGAVAVVLRYLLVPLAEPADDLSLALRIEDRYPLLNDASGDHRRVPRPDAAAGGRVGEHAREAVRRTLTRVEGLDFGRVVDEARLGLAVLLALGDRGDRGRRRCRRAAPGGGRRRPARHALRRRRLAEEDVDPLSTRSPGGSASQQGVSRYWHPERGGAAGGDAGAASRGVPAAAADVRGPAGRAAFAVHLKPDEVQRSFAFQVHAGDADDRRDCGRGAAVAHPGAARRPAVAAGAGGCATLH